MNRLTLIRVNGVSRLVLVTTGADGRARVRLSEICRIWQIPVGGVVCIGC